MADADGTETSVEPDYTIPFADGSRYDLWGRLRAARNVDPKDALSPSKFLLLEQGIGKFVDTLPRAVADSSEVMLMFEGQLVGDPGRTDRIVAILSGTCYSPKVFDFSLCEFWPADCANAEELVFPALVRLRTRQTRISDRFQCVDTQTSSELAASLNKLFCKIRLFKLLYSIPNDIDGTLLWSRVSGAEDLGIFWQEGQKKPWVQVASLPQIGSPSKRASSQACGAMTRLLKTPWVAQPRPQRGGGRVVIACPGGVAPELMGNRWRRRMVKLCWPARASASPRRAALMTQANL